MRAAGARAVMLYVIQIPSADSFAIARDIDTVYGAAFELARKAGVEMLAWRCSVKLDRHSDRDAGSHRRGIAASGRRDHGLTWFAIASKAAPEVQFPRHRSRVAVRSRLPLPRREPGRSTQIACVGRAYAYILRDMRPWPLPLRPTLKHPMTYVDAAVTPLRKTGQIKIHGPAAFAGMRKAGQLAAELPRHARGRSPSGRHDRPHRPAGLRIRHGSWRHSGDIDVSGLSQVDLHVRQSRRLPRHPDATSRCAKATSSTST